MTFLSFPFSFSSSLFLLSAAAKKEKLNGHQRHDRLEYDTAQMDYQSKDVDESSDLVDHNLGLLLLEAQWNLRITETLYVY